MTSSKIAPAASQVAALAALWAVLPGPVAAAEGAARTTSALTLQGRCRTLVFDGEDRSSACASQVINVSHPNGRTGFYFGTRDGTIVVFSSDGTRQTVLNPDTVSTPVDRMLVTRKGVVKQSIARGACVFGNPNVRPVAISCTAYGEGKVSLGRFISNLERPKIQEFGGGL